MKKKILSLLAVFALLFAVGCSNNNSNNNDNNDNNTQDKPGDNNQDNPGDDTPDTPVKPDEKPAEPEPVLGKESFASPNGTETAAGTKEEPYDIYTAISKLTPGDKLYLLEGTYDCPTRIMVSNAFNGTALNRITVTNYNNGRVILDFSKMIQHDNNRGFQINANYWTVSNIEVKGAGDNGMYIAGSYNIVDNCLFYENQDTGLQLGRAASIMTDVSEWPHNNLIKNCTSFNNYDPVTLGENADGFAAKLTVGEANVFDGCIAYRNSDDGWDLYAKSDSGNVGTTIIKNCVAFENGWTLDGTVTPNGDGIGFKLGGSNMAGNVIIENSMAFNNRLHGISDNSNPGVLSIHYCTVYNNSVSVNLDGTVGPNTNTSNNLDTSRTELCYNNYYGVLSYTTNQNNPLITNYTNDDAYRGSIGYSVVNAGISKYNYFKDFVDGSSYENSKSGSVFTGMSDDVFAALTLNEAVQNNVNFHKTLRNEDGSVNMGDMLFVTDKTLSTFGKDGESIGATLNKKSWDEYDHYEFTEFTDRTLSKDYIECQSALDAITIMCNNEAVFQNVNLLTTVNGHIINWTSSNEENIKIGEELVINSPSKANAYAAIILRDRTENKDVELIASVTVGSVTLQKAFKMTLIKEVAGIGNIKGFDDRYICEQFEEFEAPDILVEDINSYTGLLLTKDDYHIDYSYQYAQSSTSKFYDVSQVYTSVPGVYRVNCHVKSDLGDDVVKTASYIVYVVSTSSPIDLVDEESNLLTTYNLSNPLEVNVSRDGVDVKAVYSNILGTMYVLTSTQATVDADTVISTGQAFNITDEFLQVVANNENTNGYYVHVVVTNKAGNYKSSVYTKQITTQNISSEEDFFKLVTNNTESTVIYSLTKDLDFSTFDNSKWNNKKSTEAALKGLFNGNGHKISNITINNATDKQCNVLYKLSGGTIMNVTFENITMVDNSDYSKASTKDIGIVGQMAGGYIHNVELKNITAFGKERVAALVGQVCGGVNYITQVSLINDETATIGCLNKYAGGIVGNVEKDTQEYSVELNITNCYVNAKIGTAPDGKLYDAGGYIGGIVGRLKNANLTDVAKVSYCYFKGIICTTKDYTGGIVGGNDNATGYISVHHCVSDTIFHWKADENRNPINIIDGKTPDVNGVILMSQKNDSPIYGRLTVGGTQIFYDNYGNLADSNSAINSVADDFYYEISTLDFWINREFDMENIWNYDSETKVVTLK